MSVRCQLIDFPFLFFAMRADSMRRSSAVIHLPNVFLGECVC